MPRPRHCISPRHTGKSGEPSAKQEMMSVPPEIDDSWTSGLMLSYTKSKLCGESGDPVERNVRTLSNVWLSRGTNPLLATTSKYFAEAPNTVMRSASA